MIKKLLITLALITTPVNAQNITESIDETLCPQFFPFDMETKRNDLMTICRINYAVIYDKTCKIPLLTFERLRPEDIDGTEPRSDRFLEDKLIPEYARSTLKDYKKSGYDRGHMVPAGDMKENTASMEQTFFLSNMIPQDPKLNRTIWKNIESDARDFVNENRDTFIITGTITENGETIGNEVCIPDKVFKIAIDVDDSKNNKFWINRNAPPYEYDSNLSETIKEFSRVEEVQW